VVWLKRYVVRPPAGASGLDFFWVIRRLGRDLVEQAPESREHRPVLLPSGSFLGPDHIGKRCDPDPDPAELDRLGITIQILVAGRPGRSQDQVEIAVPCVQIPELSPEQGGGVMLKVDPTGGIGGSDPCAQGCQGFRQKRHVPKLRIGHDIDVEGHLGRAVQRRRQAADDDETDVVRRQLAQDQAGLKPAADGQDRASWRRPSRIKAT